MANVTASPSSAMLEQKVLNSLLKRDDLKPHLYYKKVNPKKGIKKHQIIINPKKIWFKGATVHLVNQKGKLILIPIPIIKVVPIILTEDMIALNKNKLSPSKRFEFIQNEGFPSIALFLKYYQSKMPVKGVVLVWSNEVNY